MRRFMPDPRFMPRPQQPAAQPGYYEVPADVLEDAEQLVAWARKAVAVAARKRLTKRPAKRAANPPAKRANRSKRAAPRR